MNELPVLFLVLPGRRPQAVVPEGLQVVGELPPGSGPRLGHEDLLKAAPEAPLLEGGGVVGRVLVEGYVPQGDQVLLPARH